MGSVNPTRTEKVEQAESFWSRLTNYNALLLANVAFLRGHIYSTPYHGGPINKETIPLVPNLIKLQCRGLFTIDGQPALIGKPEFSKVVHGWIDDQEVTSRDAYIEEKQKAYIEFLMPQGPSYNAFVEHLAQNENSYKMLATIDDNIVSSSFREDEFYPLTIYRIGKTLSDLSNADWYKYTTVNPHSAGITEALIRNAPNFGPIIKGFWHIILCIPKFGVGNLEEELLVLCDQFGLPTLINPDTTKFIPTKPVKSL